jgi:lysophospholipase L1-like esterase
VPGEKELPSRREGNKETSVNFPQWPAQKPGMARFIRVLVTLAAVAMFSNFSAAQTPPSASEAATNSPTVPPQNRGWGGFAGPADKPAPRRDANSQLAHQQLLEKAKKGGIDIYFEGDSITRRWGASDPMYKDNLANWNTNFFGWNAADFGWGADRVENILWRLENGELDGVNPKIIVLLAGINNVGAQPGNDAKVEDITRGLKAVVDICRTKAPDATIIITGIFPRNDNMAVIPTINKINDNLASMADGKKIRYLNVNDRLADQGGKLFDGMMNSRDKLHPTVQGYQVWADGLKPIFTELLGPPAATDHAPAPTGDPSAHAATPAGH